MTLANKQEFPLWLTQIAHERVLPEAAPAMIWAIREQNRQSDAADAVETFRTEVVSPKNRKQS
jgi:hypothetical protein